MINQASYARGFKQLTGDKLPSNYEVKDELDKQGNFRPS